MRRAARSKRSSRSVSSVVPPGYLVAAARSAFGLPTCGGVASIVLPDAWFDVLSLSTRLRSSWTAGAAAPSLLSPVASIHHRAILSA